MGIQELLVFDYAKLTCINYVKNGCIMRKWMVGLLFLMLSCMAYSTTYTDKATISSITVGKDLPELK
jgi:hypothetical protein